MNKKGFTLVEILAVMALLSIILLLTVPNLTSLFKNSAEKTMEVQKKEISNAALLYLEDYCKNPIGVKVCPLSKNDEKYTGTIALSELENNDYIDDVYYKEAKCNGCINFDNNDIKINLECGHLEYRTHYYNCANDYTEKYACTRSSETYAFDSKLGPICKITKKGSSCSSGYSSFSSTKCYKKATLYYCTEGSYRYFSANTNGYPGGHLCLENKLSNTTCPSGFSKATMNSGRTFMGCYKFASSTTNY